MPARIHIDRDRIAAFCRRHRVKKLSLFGSVLRDDFDPETSDVDVLVEFESGAQVGYFTMGRMIVELRELLGRDVDLRTPNEISRYFRDEVLDSAEVQFAA
ncbi:MAG: nucleotidyltransferase family protein [Phycisphaeraceae bacterium]